MRQNQEPRTKSQKLRIKRIAKTAVICLCSLFLILGSCNAQNDTIADIQKHYAQLRQAYNGYSMFVLNAEKAYVVDNLNFRVLHNSPLYKDYIQYWVGSYELTANSKAQFEQQLKSDILKTLARLFKQNEKETAENLAKDLTNFNLQMGFDNAALEIVKYMQSVDNEFFNKNKKLTKILTSAQLMEYKIPPEIVGLQDNNLKNCLIIFFDSDCGHCQDEIEKIISNYDKLLQKNIRVISIAADIDKTNYDKFSAKFLWRDKLCDFKGMGGDNFNNYGVSGTPTLFLTDGEGKIVGTAAHFEEVF